MGSGGLKRRHRRKRRATADPAWDPRDGLEPDPGLPFEREPVSRISGGIVGRSAAWIIRRVKRQGEGTWTPPFPWRAIGTGALLVITLFGVIVLIAGIVFLLNHLL